MFAPLFFANPGLYLAMKSAARLRHFMAFGTIDDPLIWMVYSI